MPISYPVEIIRPIPKPGEAGYFGAIRKYDIHTGIDLYCQNDCPVYSIREGTVVNIEKFTGQHADSPWWNDTSAILIEGTDGVILYGELVPDASLKVGDHVSCNQHIGNIKQVLKVDKGVNPTSMLHLELYTHGTTKSVWWKHGEHKPSNLLNPITLLGNSNELF